MIITKKTGGFYLLLLILGLSSCSRKNFENSITYQFKSKNGLPDYGNLNYWAAHPYKHNTSDSLPTKLKKNFIKDSLVDVFFLYPTSYTDKAKPFGYNAPIDNAAINSKTDYNSILYQASIFNIAGRVFAPRYRQANYYCYLPINKEDSLKAIAAFDTAYSDIKQAFEYYLKNYNNGRPIIIASHSQGTTHAKRLLKEFFDNTILQQKLVVAYLVGMPIEKKYFYSIDICSNENQTGCYCTWRTYEENFIPAFVSKENNSVAVTNPLTWNEDKTVTTIKDNEGSILRNFKVLKKHVTNAVTKQGYIGAKHPKFFGSFLLRTKNYHIADYNFYYLSVRKNVAHRINMYWKR